jgi:hypothetical protein
MISGIYNLLSTDVSQNPIQELWLECDTTLAPVTINLFEIAELQRQWSIKIHISDASNNASANAITINASPLNFFDNDSTSQISINANGSAIILQVASETQWFAIESVTTLESKFTLIAGDPLSGGDIRVLSDFQPTSGLVEIPPLPTPLKSFEYVARVDFDGLSNVYAHYLGVVTVDLGSSFGIGADVSTITCQDSSITGEINSPLTNGGWVTNPATGQVEQLANAFINYDNTIGNPNEYYFFLLTGNPNDFECVVNLYFTTYTNSSTVNFNRNV